LLVVPIAIAAWYLVFVVGILTHGFLEEALRPTGELVSGVCANPRVRAFMDVIVHIFVGLSAIAVELAAAVMAPTFKERTTWLAFAVGGAIAVAFGAAGAYGEAVTALTGGLMAAILITRHLARSSRALGTHPTHLSH
jgi:hypothetical protein